MFKRVILCLAITLCTLSAIVYAQSFELEIIEEEYRGDLFEDLEVVADMGYSMAALYRDGDTQVYVPIKYDSKTKMHSPSIQKELKLKKGDIIDLWTKEVKEGFYIADEIFLKRRPDPTIEQIQKGRKKAEDNFSLVPDNVQEQISRVIVDTRNQNVYVYGPFDEVWFISRCVTGRRGWNIPSGNYKIRTKERNRYLDGRQYGEDYHLWVYYWMPFFGGAGLHDAGWRSTFWIDHNYYGSHGCINLPIETAKFIYNHSKVGTRVIVR